MTVSKVYSAESMKVAAGVMQDTVELIKGDCRDIRRILADLAERWKGDASITMQRVMTDWDTQQGRLLTALEAIRDRMTKTSEKVILDEEERKAALAQLGLGTDGGAALVSNSVVVGDYSAGLHTNKH